MILVIGYRSEGTIAHLLTRLELREIRYRILDLGQIRKAIDLRVCQSPEDLCISVDGDNTVFSRYSGFFTRCYYVNGRVPIRNTALSTVVTAVSSFLEHTRSTVINRPSAGTGNGNKLVHGAYLRQLGFAVPNAHILV